MASIPNSLGSLPLGGTELAGEQETGSTPPIPPSVPVNQYSYGDGKFEILQKYLINQHDSFSMSQNYSPGDSIEDIERKILMNQHDSLGLAQNYSYGDSEVDILRKILMNQNEYIGSV